jgi:hypothetical protein
VVIGKKISKAQPGESSKKPKGSPIIDLSDDKEVCISYLHSNLFRFSLSLNSKTNLLQDNDTKTIHEHTLARIQSEKRSKKKHESDASDSTAKIQDPPIVDQTKKEKKKDKKHKRPKIKTDETEEGGNETLLSDQNVEGEDRSEKKKHRKRKHKKISSSSDDSQANTSKLVPGEESLPKRQKITTESFVPVSQRLFILCYSFYSLCLISSCFTFA